MKYQIIDSKKITELLFDDDQYVIEFCEAGLTSFGEFIDNFSTHLLDRNMEELKKAGHKIKPGAKMMGADVVVEEYEHAKKLLREEAAKEKLSQSVEKMKDICSTIQDELTHLAQNPNPN